MNLNCLEDNKISGKTHTINHMFYERYLKHVISDVSIKVVYFM